MDVWQLAQVINEARVRNLVGDEELIVAEHMLSERLARIQARPGYIATVAGFVGIVGGAFLTSALQKSEAPLKCACECESGYAAKQNVADPTRFFVSPVENHRAPAFNDILGKGAQEGASQMGRTLTNR
ncbi:MAG: hypothetical protein ACOZAQ_03050 [Pseudomonadota bacterium]